MAVGYFMPAAFANQPTLTVRSAFLCPCATSTHYIFTVQINHRLLTPAPRQLLQGDLHQHHLKLFLSRQLISRHKTWFDTSQPQCRFYGPAIITVCRHFNGVCCNIRAACFLRGFFFYLFILLDFFTAMFLFYAMDYWDSVGNGSIFACPRVSSLRTTRHAKLV